MIGACVRCGGTDRFSVNIKKQIFNCRGCSASGDVIALTQHIDRCDFMTAVRTLDSGAEMAASRNGDNRQIEPRQIDLVNQAQIDGQNTERALKLWADAVPIVGTIAERYLHGRGLHDLPGDDVLQFHPSCPFGKSRVACLLALYTDIATNEPRAISRTAISAAGNKIGRMSLGPVGGAVVKIDGDENIESGLTIGEELETCLAARQFGFRPIWSVGSAGAIKSFPVLAGIDALTIIVDHDEGDRNGRQAGQEAALACSARWTAAGVEVRRIVPRNVGADMADLIEHGGSHAA